MTQQDEAEIAKLMREARDLRRGYADFFQWAIDRDLEEWDVATILNESLAAEGRTFFSKLRSRGRPDDPPDCEALDSRGTRLTIEVTELVDGKAIEVYKRAEKERRLADCAEWPREKFLAVLQERLSAKDSRFTV